MPLCCRDMHAHRHGGSALVVAICTGHAGIVCYAAPANYVQDHFLSEVQSHSPEWPKPTKRGIGSPIMNSTRLHNYPVGNLFRKFHGTRRLLHRISDWRLEHGTPHWLEAGRKRTGGPVCQCPTNHTHERTNVIIIMFYIFLFLLFSLSYRSVSGFCWRV